jgi:hypothetical protein
MDRREMLGLVGAGAVGLTSAAVGRAQQQEHRHHAEHDKHLDTINECFKVCNETAHHCLEQTVKNPGDARVHAKIHEMAMDCQAFCALTSALMARHSDLMAYAHQSCAEACRCCAETCESATTKSAQVTDCAKACRACEKVCREMSKPTKAGTSTGR